MTDSRVKILLLLMVGILAITLEQPHSLGLLAVGTALSLTRSGIRRQWLKRGMLVVVALVWTTVFSQALFYGDQPRTILVKLGPAVFWSEGVEHGLVQPLRFIAVALGGVALAVSTPPDRLLLGMQRLGLPSGLAFLTVTALRFIPTVGSEFLIVRTARAHRGRSVWRRSPLAWLRLELGLLRPVLARTLRRSRALAESMDIRGFDASTARRSRRRLHWTPLNSAQVTAGFIITASAVSAKALYTLYTAGLAYHPELRGLYGWVRNWL